MRTLLLFTFFVLASSVVYSQIEKDPILGSFLDLSFEGEQAFIQFQKECDELFESKKEAFAHFTEEEEMIRDSCFDMKENYWDSVQFGCSWYCGGGPDSISATSALGSINGINYEVNNIHDFDLKTVWSEGIEGYGIGESITYYFEPQSPRITDFIIINGYVKSEKAWRENSRVKKLKVYFNEEEFAILNLDDSKHEQYFEFEPIGHSKREDELEEIKNLSLWTLRFEILEVYKGEKYDDTVITEIYFDGIDVH